MLALVQINLSTCCIPAPAVLFRCQDEDDIFIYQVIFIYNVLPLLLNLKPYVCMYGIHWPAPQSQGASITYYIFYSAREQAVL